MSDTKRRSVAVVTDSTAYLPPELVEKYGIWVVPQHLLMGDRRWLDGLDIVPPVFYELLRSSEGFPTTSPPTVDDFHRMFAEVSKEAERIVAILVSHELSETVESARQAAARLADVPIDIIDSRGVAMSLGFPVLAAARAAAEGASLGKVVAAARWLVGRTFLYFVADSLKHLSLGGRIGGASRFLGTTLDLKPILELRDGRVEPLARVRSWPKALEKVYQLIGERVIEGDKLHMAVMNIAAPEAVAVFREELEARFRPVEMMEAEVSPVVGAHVGPGAVGVAFYIEHAATAPLRPIH